MLLNNYLTENGLSFSEFARRIGTRHARTVERYAKNQSIPNRVMMEKIVAETGGKVQPNDFYPATAAE